MNELAQHMVDTVKEWQCKIGVRKEKMDLFYPLESLKELLQLDPAASTEELEKILTEFQKENASLFGKLHFWKEKKRYGIEIPEDGVIHIAETIPDPEFLKSFLKVIQNPASNMDDVCNCFQQFAKENGPQALWDRLNQVDPQAAEKIHPNNVGRVARALEVYHTTGIPISKHQELSRTKPFYEKRIRRS